MHHTGLASSNAVHRRQPAYTQFTLQCLSLLRHASVSPARPLQVLALLVSVLAGHVHANDGPGTGELMLANGTGEQQALLLDATLTLDVQGLLGTLRLTQTFKNTSAEWLDGRYVFPLPADAIVRDFQVQVGDRIIDAELREREDAAREFEQAQRTGQVAALVEQQRPNLFSTRLASIEPGKDITVSLDIVLPVAVLDDQASITLPTTFTPRYVNQATPDPDAISAPFAELSDIRGPRVTLTANVSPLDELTQLSSNTHLLIRRERQVALDEVAMDRDIELNWPLSGGASAGGHVAVAEHAGERYVQVLLTPPDRAVSGTRLPRELVLVIDKSGSMAGEPMRAARAAINRALGGLDENDTFNLIAFDDTMQMLFGASQAVSADTQRSAQRFVASLQADGGTEIAEPLITALNLPSQDRIRQVVFVTDGSVGNEDQILRDITRQLGRSRLFMVGIGSAPNRWFLDEAARAGRGTSLSIRETGDVDHTMARLLADLQHPVLTDVTVQVTGGAVEWYPDPLPDLYQGRPVSLVGRLIGAPTDVVIEARQGDKPWQQRIKLPTIEPRRDSSASSTLAPLLALNWARQRIDAWLDEQRQSADPTLHRSSITALALDAGLVTRYTSLVAVEQTVSRPGELPARSTDVTNLIPDGNEMLQVNMPRGAAGIDTLAWLGALLGLAGLLLMLASRQLKDPVPGADANDPWVVR